MPERAEKRKRVYTGIIAAAALVLVLCIGLVIGGALVYGATQLTDWFSPDDSRAIVLDREETEERAEEPSIQTFATGAVLVEVIPGGPAADAGLQPDDVIVAVDGRRVGPVRDLADRISGYEPGDQVELTVQRSSRETSQVIVRLGENPDVSGAAYLGVRYTMSQGFRGQRQGPYTVPPMDEFELPFDMPFHGNMQGVVIAQVTANTPAAEAGLESGDLITAINGEAVTTPDEVVAAVSQYEPGDRITLTILGLKNGEEEAVPVVLGEHPDDADKAYLGVYLGGGMHMEGFDQGELPERFRFFFHGQPFDSEDLPFDWDDLPFGRDDDGRFFEFQPEFGEGNDA
ncbi:MAG: PDZ domain-containing protein [Anaerolineae bacterium]